MKLIQNLGNGGFGIVDLVEDDVGNRYARKNFNYAASNDPKIIDNVLKRFEKEAKTQKGLSHRNIVPVLATHFNAKPPYYLMPAAEASLFDDMQTDRTLGGHWLAAISDIVDGLEELHGLKIFHRDLKPKNVLRFSDGGDSYYAISDFGLISRKESQLSTLTLTGMAKGSDHYTAPELTNDLRKATESSDVYSLGCIIHDMVGTEDRVPLHEIREEGPYAPILLNCTRAKPDRRFKSARAVLNALLAVEDGDLPPESETANDFVEVLEGDGNLDVDTTQRLADYLQYKASDIDRRAICLRLKNERIQEICSLDKEAASRIALTYATWVRETAFNFESCDQVADRVEAFISGCNMDAQVECLLSLLSMGTSHNRWYVERKFLSLCSSDMNDVLAKRLAVEFHVGGEDICTDIAHLELSIRVSRDSLHPRLANALKQICS